MGQDAGPVQEITPLGKQLPVASGCGSDVPTVSSGASSPRDRSQTDPWGSFPLHRGWRRCCWEAGLDASSQRGSFGKALRLADAGRGVCCLAVFTVCCLPSICGCVSSDGSHDPAGFLFFTAWHGYPVLVVDD